MPKVVFEPDGVEREVIAGTRVVEAAGRAGIALRTPCGRRGLCGKCRIIFLSGAPEPGKREAEVLGERELKEGCRLACASRIARDATVRVPQEARLYRHRVLEEGRATEAALDPKVRLREVKMPAPTLDDQKDDCSRLLDALGDREEFRAGVDFLRRLPRELRRCGFEVELVEYEGELLDARRGGSPVLGAAVDVGTTTVVGAVHDLRTGALLGRASATNPQAAFGDDVVSRMDHAREEPGLAELREAISGCVDRILRDCCASAGARAEDLYEIVVAGNTVMTLLFFGIDPLPVATVPFAPATLGPVRAKARELGLAFPRARVWSVPCVSGYVGGDIVAGLVASGARQRDGASLYIDIGTNGEIVLCAREKIHACSAAAGPAFEGARISCGMRAEAGAIDHAELRDAHVAFTTIGSARARGICGTGLIDLVACLLNAGLVDKSGAFRKKGPAAKKLRGERFVVSAGRGRRGISLTQRDVRELQLAKGAILAGTRLLARAAGVEPAGIDHVLLAGAFGNYIDPSNALALGLLPPEIPVERIEFVGNAAFAGASAALLDDGFRRRMEETARSIEYVELSAIPEFQEEFAEAMFFPGAP